MLDEELTKTVKFHKVEGTNYEWIEYPTDSYIVEDIKKEGYYILVCANTLKNQVALIQELKELYGSEVEVMERWVRIEVLKDSTGKVVKHKNIVHNCTPPIIQEGFTHSLSFRGKDKNYLEFIKWDIEKKLEERKKLAKLDIKVEEPNNEPSPKIEGGEHKGTIDIPHFLNVEDNSKMNKYNMLESASVDEILKAMDEVMNDFFKGFPKNF